MPKCPHCPVRDRDEPCRAEVTGHWRFCQLADPQGPDYSPAMVARLKGESVPFPSIARRAANLAGAAVDAVASGGKTVGAEERDRRLSICHGCDQFVEGRCAQCGCVLSWKARLEAWHCPIGKW